MYGCQAEYLRSVKLQDPATGKYVDGGADIPLEQIFAGPRRGLLKSEPSSGDRSIGQMIAGKGHYCIPK